MEEKIIDELFKLQDKKYAKFQSKLTPSVEEGKFIGVRVPDLRKFAREYANVKEVEKFLRILPHNYYDENMLHGLLISGIKDYEICVKEVDKFLPYVDNWAVCDIMSPIVFKKNKDKLIIKIKEWIKSKHTYTCRFGINMLMKYYLDEAFKKDYLEMIAKIHFDEYYVQMMLAWFFATALVKKWDETIIYLEEKRLDKWVHNKTIQKAIESFRITDKQKEYLRTLKR